VSIYLRRRAAQAKAGTAKANKTSVLGSGTGTLIASAAVRGDIKYAAGSFGNR
jgi:hypothetical protein